MSDKAAEETITIPSDLYHNLVLAAYAFQDAAGAAAGAAGSAAYATSLTQAEKLVELISYNIT